MSKELKERFGDGLIGRSVRIHKVFVDASEDKKGDGGLYHLRAQQLKNHVHDFEEYLRLCGMLQELMGVKIGG